MRDFKGFYFMVIFLISKSLFAVDDLKIFVGADTRGTDSIYDSKYYEKSSGNLSGKRYGYEGYLGGSIGVEYFFNKKNGVRTFLGLGYANIKLLNSLDKFDLFSGVATKIQADYLLNYYSDKKFDFGFFAGLA
ncbi:hypothetical protein BKH41_04760 [Helicobacter sp. 12S02232-10]|uniref:hypothetical protein n=1 Tax=Helicobacter sp. 12S02232-10 TaxID=1476197 RepID=UPI000BA5C533|nr:hypothetical protein [Helicobacter sp. 12S02232-10]PAF48942.1 hypothetical protein BKH41_04760 [Helicobacter sp. 12S02232-10]